MLLTIYSEDDICTISLNYCENKSSSERKKGICQCVAHAIRSFGDDDSNQSSSRSASLSPPSTGSAKSLAP